MHENKHVSIGIQCTERSGRKSTPCHPVPGEKARKERVGIMPWPSTKHFSVYASVVPEAHKCIIFLYYYNYYIYNNYILYIISIIILI